jgi:signal transduction histidine kinase
LNFILNSVTKMDQLLSGLLRISRLGRSALTITTVEMNTVMAQVVAGHEFQLKQYGVTVSIDPLPSCRGDQVQVDQVFANLIGNAIKFRHPNRPGRIRVTGQVDGEVAVYCIADNGIGIARSHQEKVFEIFHQLAPETEGQGLGLNIVRKILDRLDGKVWIESEADQYCKFFVALPKAAVGSDGGAMA